MLKWDAPFTFLTAKTRTRDQLGVLPNFGNALVPYIVCAIVQTYNDHEIPIRKELIKILCLWLHGIHD